MPLNPAPAAVQRRFYVVFVQGFRSRSCTASTRNRNRESARFLCLLSGQSVKQVPDIAGIESEAFQQNQVLRAAGGLGLLHSFAGGRFLSRENAPANELAFITGKGREKDLYEAVAGIRDFASASIIRVL